MRFRICFLLVLAFAMGVLPAVLRAEDKPLKALLVTGGCCHDYPYQSEQLTVFASMKAKIEWKVVNEGGNGTKAMIELYNDPDWAKPFDVVVHNECFADTADEAYIKRITAAHHAGVPAVVIHCAMHTYRAAKFDDWRQFLGVTSRHHEHQSRYPVTPVNAQAAAHPAMKGFPKEGWTTPKDELYIVEKLWPTARALAMSKSEKTGQEQPVIWINQFGKARVFGTTYGHSKETFADETFLNIVTHGLLWAAGREEK